MARWKTLAAMTTFGLLMLGMGLVVGNAQQKKTNRLTPQDYIDIQQLVAKYPYALDGGLENGKAYADLFTDDAEFHQQPTAGYPSGRVWTGRKELLTIAKKEVETPNALGHFIMNHMIEPTADGATGKAYLFTVSPFVDEKSGRRTFTITPYHYEDVYRKTPEGWRFKSRTVVEKAETTRQRANR
jgi:SnoaL-like protein